MHIDQWLQQCHDEQTKKASPDLEEVFSWMEPEDLIKVANGEATVDEVLNRMADGQESASMPVERTKVAALPFSTSFAPSDKLQFMDKIARQIAREHARVTQAAEQEKQAKCGTSHGGMVKRDEFTTPEAQQKAKTMQTAMSASKGTPAKVRKAAVKHVGQKIASINKEAISREMLIRATSKAKSLARGAAKRATEGASRKGQRAASTEAIRRGRQASRLRFALEKKVGYGL